mgnify:CR=1 FL=1
MKVAFVFVLIVAFVSTQQVERILIDNFSVGAGSQVIDITLSETLEEGQQSINNTDSLAEQGCGGELLGCGRDMQLEVFSGLNGRNFASAIFNSSIPAFPQFVGEWAVENPKTSSSKATLQYDGTDDSFNLDLNGLGGLDLTEGGLATDMVLAVYTDLSFVYIIQIYDTTGGLCEANLTVPATPVDYDLDDMLVEIPLSEFSGCDLENVGAMQFVLSSDDAIDALLRRISIDGLPDPSQSLTPTPTPTPTLTPSLTPTLTSSPSPTISPNSVSPSVSPSLSSTPISEAPSITPCQTSTASFSCTEPELLLDGSCVDSCPSGRFDNGNGICDVCDTSCETCSNSADSCDTCNSPELLEGNSCVSSCSSSTFDNGAGVCEECSPSCAKCSGTASTCTSCVASKVLEGNVCVIPCTTCDSEEVPIDESGTVEVNDISGVNVVSSSAFTAGQTLQVTAGSSTDFDAPLPQGETFSKVLVLELFDEAGNPVQPEGEVEICFQSNFVGDSSELCLAFINSSGDWECQDLNLNVTDGQLCGVTDHFTEFALLQISEIDPNEAPSASPSTLPSPSRTPLAYDYTYSVNTLSYFTRSYEYTYSSIDDFFTFSLTSQYVYTDLSSTDSESDSSSSASTLVVSFFVLLAMLFA